MPTRTVIALATLVALVGCAGTPRDEAPSPSRTAVLVHTPGAGTQTMTLTRDANTASVILPRPAAELWPALVAAYRDMGLEVTGADTGRRILVSGGKRVREIARRPVARFFDCPGTAYGNTAASGEVYPMVRTQLLGADSAQTEVRIQVEATAVSSSGHRGRCNSTGRLEEILRDALIRS